MLSLLAPLSQFAAACNVGRGGISGTIIPTWYKYLGGTTDSTGHCAVSFVFPDDAGAIALAIVDILLRIGAIVAVGYVFYGGFQYLISQGEPDKTKGARQTIINALVGLVISLMATAIVTLIGGQLA
jgi:hypothetical protein